VAQKNKRQKVTRLKVPSDARNTKIRSASIVASTSARVNVSKLTPRSLSARSRALNVLADMRRSPSLTFTQAARNREINPRSVRRYVISALRKDSAGRIKARVSDRFRETIYIPSTKPDERIPIRTRNNRERQLIGQWLKAVNAAGRGDFLLIREFQSGQMIDGVLLPTGPYQIQRLLEALADEESPYEGLYRTLVRPS
jgi:hypothetical protein